MENETDLMQNESSSRLSTQEEVAQLAHANLMENVSLEGLNENDKDITVNSTVQCAKSNDADFLDSQEHDTRDIVDEENNNSKPKSIKENVAPKKIVI